MHMHILYYARACKNGPVSARPDKSWWDHCPDKSTAKWEDGLTVPCLDLCTLGYKGKCKFELVLVLILQHGLQCSFHHSLEDV